MRAIVFTQIALAALTASSNTSAETISFNFAGNITSAEVRKAAIPFNAGAGDAFTGNVTYAISSSVVVSGPGVFNFEVASISITTNGSLFVAQTTPNIWSCWKLDSATCPTGPVSISMTDNGIDGDKIQYSGRSLSFNGANLPSIFKSSSIHVDLLDSIYRTAVSSTLVPISEVPKADSFNNKAFSLFGYGSDLLDGPLLNINGRIDSITAAPVPEASTRAMLIAGIFLLTFFYLRVDKPSIIKTFAAAGSSTSCIPKSDAFAQPDILRQSRYGLHFIIAQTPPTAKCQLAQTLGVAPRECADMQRSKYRVRQKRNPYEDVATGNWNGASRQRAAPRSQIVKRRAEARRRDGRR